MTSIVLNVPDSFLSLVNGYIKAGVFKTNEELFLAALSEFVSRNQLELLDHFANEDIEWAKKQKKGLK
jgi:hypothetical protein